MGMYECLGLILIGFIAGFLAAWHIVRSESKDEIEKFDPPILFSEEKNIVIANAEIHIPQEDFLYPLSSKFIERELSNKLAEEIWKYAMVTMDVDKRNMCNTYRARLRVIDMGQLNPLCGERREGE